jgi:hypothetical protein
MPPQSKEPLDGNPVTPLVGLGAKSAAYLTAGTDHNANL